LIAEIVNGTNGIIASVSGSQPMALLLLSLCLIVNSFTVSAIIFIDELELDEH
jgi:hypothetical protein